MLDRDTAPRKRPSPSLSGKIGLKIFVMKHNERHTTEFHAFFLGVFSIHDFFKSLFDYVFF